MLLLLFCIAFSKEKTSKNNQLQPKCLSPVKCHWIQITREHPKLLWNYLKSALWNLDSRWSFAAISPKYVRLHLFSCEKNIITIPPYNSELSFGLKLPCFLVSKNQRLLMVLLVVKSWNWWTGSNVTWSEAVFPAWKVWSFGSFGLRVWFCFNWNWLYASGATCFRELKIVKVTPCKTTNHGRMFADKSTTGRANLYFSCDMKYLFFTFAFFWDEYQFFWLTFKQKQNKKQRHQLSSKCALCLSNK